MAYTVTKLITESYYLSGVVARALQTVSGDQISDGLDLLNGLLQIKFANERLIPYYKQYNFSAASGQEEYYIPQLIEVETFTFNIGPVRYSMQPMGRRQYFGSGRVDNITSLPFNWHAERELGGTRLYVYFKPSQDFPLIIHGKFALNNVALNDDLSLMLDGFYIQYLRFALAEFICSDYNIVFNPQSNSKLTELESIIADVSPPDLTLTKMSSLSNNTSLNWGDINLGLGWRPS
jgi:hypothetical protein